MKKWFIWSCAITILLGTAWHFFYTWCPHMFVGLFAPINESVWEHLKLLFWPVLPAVFVLGWKFGKRQVWSSFLVTLLWMPVVLLSVYYLFSAGFGVECLAFDIILYVLVLIAGFAGAYRLSLSGRAMRCAGILLMLVGLYATILVLFSLAAPPFPIFMPPLSSLFLLI